MKICPKCGYEVKGYLFRGIVKRIDMDKLRRCKGRYWFQEDWHEFELGYFHRWGSNFEEFENGAGNYSVAIVELPDGRIVTPVADDITFLDSFEK